MNPGQYIGRRLKRKEDRRVLIGETSYVDDLKPQGCLQMGIIRSTQPRAEFRIDLSSIQKRSEVLLTITGDEINNETGNLPLISAPSGCRSMPSKALASGMTTFVGEPLAAIVVEGNRYLLNDLLDMVQVEYTPYEAVTDPLKALEPGSELVHRSWGDNVAYSTRIRRGDVESAFAHAYAIVSEDFHIVRQYGSAIEPRGVIASYESASSQLTVWSSTQWPHFVRTLLSEVLNHPENLVRVIAPDVGGGFGNKQDLYREEVLVSYAAKKLARPVKWIATRSEDFISTVHSGDQIHKAEMALSRDGSILALKDHFVADVGAYGPMSLGPPYLTLLNMTGPYRIDNVDIETKCVVTNKVPIGAYRGFGQQQAAFVLERLVDEAARTLGMHPIQIRRVNAVDTFPYKTATGRVIDTGNYTSMLQKAEQTFKQFSELRLGPYYMHGVGVAFGFESSGIGPSFIQNSSGARHKGYETMTVRIHPDGKIEIFTALSPHGQGLETTLSQVCADLLGVRPEDVVVRHGDTMSTPYGFGTWGSRSAVLGAGALMRCVEQLKGQMILVVSKLFDEPMSELKYQQGEVVSEKSGRRISLKRIAKLAYEAFAVPAPLEATSVYEPKGLAVSGGIHVVAVAVDIESFQCKIIAYANIEDSGRMINPDIVEGQLHGGIAQGIATALLERLVYSPDGQLLTNSYLEYLIPSAKELPSYQVEHMDKPTDTNELGVKGIGESGIIGPSAAIANAICDALKEHKIKVNKTPVLANELWEELKKVSKLSEPFAVAGRQ